MQKENTHWITIINKNVSPRQKHMKYAHLADLHLGSWREPKMRDLSTKAFLTAIDNCIKEQVDFILFAGDIFNTSLPALDTLKIVTKKLKQLQNHNIPLYTIAGSHDFSPSGKTMIDVLEYAGLLVNVCKGSIQPETKQLQLSFTTDHKTGAKITGVLGRKGLLDKVYYQNLSLANLEQEKGYKIFLFHTAISELMPSSMALMETQPVSFLPKGFNYYAGGHIHCPRRLDFPEYGTLTYPGVLFPNSFSELEEFGGGGYYLVTVYEPKTLQQITFMPLQILPRVSLILDCHHKTPESISRELLEKINSGVRDSLVTIRLKGTIKKGRISDIDFRSAMEKLQQQGAYLAMKNTTKLISPEFEEIQTSHSSPELIEEQVIKEHLQQIKLFDSDVELYLIKSLLQSLNTAKKEGETVPDFQQRLEEEMKKVLAL